METCTLAARWDESLSPEQRIAASHYGSHARLLAGPGTGKSYTIARHIAYLVQEQEVSADEVMILTFTRNATRELKKSIYAELEPYTNKKPYISTLHGFSLRQLRRNASLLSTLPQPLRIADDWEEKEIINKDLVRISELTRERVEDGFRNLSSDWETLDYENEGWLATVPDAGFVGAWEEQRSVYGYLLRTELVYQLKKALQQNPEFLIEPKFSHLIIDEYQDLNPCDLAIVGACADKGMTVLAVGDDDQSIYGFRNADPQGIRDFPTTFAGSAELTLEECRRCDEEILASAMWVAEQDHARIPKVLRASEGRSGGEVKILTFANDLSERINLTQAIGHYIDKGTRPQDILVLFRSDRQSTMSAPLIQELTELGISVETSIEKNPVLESTLGRVVLATLHLCFDISDSLAWRTILELTPRLGPRTVKAIYDAAIELGVTFGNAIENRDTFISNIPAAQRAIFLDTVSRTTEIVNHYSLERDAHIESSGILDVESFQSLVFGVINQILVEPEQLAETLAYFSDVIVLHGADDLSSLFAYIAIEFGLRDADVSTENVNIMTMHQAKGLTADIVIIVAAEDEIFPRSDVRRHMADDRRLLYVSMTRAKHKLIISHCNRREGQQSHSGRFPGNPRRTLTRFLRNGPLIPESGVAFVSNLTTSDAG
jgi:DNA helicase-2/ATP-dependent DNA helicase PcrA